MDTRLGTGKSRSRFIEFVTQRIQTKTPFYVIAACAAIVIVGRTLAAIWLPPMIINYTHSEPYGIYSIEPHRPAEYRRGMMVMFPVPQPFENLVYGRRWINPGHPLMKNVGALAGDQVCISDTELTINGEFIGPVFSVDSAGRDMPKIRRCFTLGPDEFFPLSTYTDKSFDGRYIGPQPLNTITGELHAIWTH